MAKWVYLFSEGNASMRELLGGKGANLAEMTGLGLPVPQGFTITTEACTQYYEDAVKLTMRFRDRSTSTLVRWKKLLVKNSVTRRIHCSYQFVLVQELLCRV